MKKTRNASLLGSSTVSRSAGVSIEFCDEFHQAAKVSIASLKSNNQVKFVKLTEDIRVDNPIPDESSLQSGIANARLSGLKGSPELDVISRDFALGKITLDEAFEAARITRRIEFEIQIRLPAELSQCDALSRLEPSCSDAEGGIGLRNHITLSFKRQGIVRDEIIEAAINDILTAIPGSEILEIRS